MLAGSFLCSSLHLLLPIVPLCILEENLAPSSKKPMLYPIKQSDSRNISFWFYLLQAEQTQFLLFLLCYFPFPLPYSYSSAGLTPIWQCFSSAELRIARSTHSRCSLANGEHSSPSSACWLLVEVLCQLNTLSVANILVLDLFTIWFSFLSDCDVYQYSKEVEYTSKEISGQDQ